MCEVIWCHWSKYVRGTMIKDKYDIFRLCRDVCECKVTWRHWPLKSLMFHHFVLASCISLLSDILQVFDTFVILTSFIVDMIFVKGLSMYTLRQFVYILAFMLPWRVIRVTNSKYTLAILSMCLLFYTKSSLSLCLKQLIHIYIQWRYF